MNWPGTRTWTDDTLEHTAAKYNTAFRDLINYGVRQVAVVGPREFSGQVLTATDLLGTVAAGAAADAASTPITIPAGQMGTRGMLRLRVVGRLSNDSDVRATIDLEMKLGGVTFFHDATHALDPQVAAQPWELVLNVAALDDPAEKFCIGFFQLGAADATATGLGNLGNVTESDIDGPMTYPIGSDGTFSIDTEAADANLEIMMTHTSLNPPAADLDKLILTRKWACVELVGQAS
jgi:hypothetical protein